MRHQRGELGPNGRLIVVVCTDERPVPLPAARFRGLNEQQHLALEEVHRKRTKHSLGEESRVLVERLENPLVIERSFISHSGQCSGF